MMLFISYDFVVIRQMCNWIGVMCNGELCEVFDCDQLFEVLQYDYIK